MRIIPAMDIIDGKCVRLSQGDYNQKTEYNANPLDQAKEFEAAGLEYLHLVDLDGAKASDVVNYNVLETIASKTNLKIDFGGGVKSDKAIERVFNFGANQVTAGSIAVKDRELVLEWINKYGADKLILGADCKNEKIAVNGWLESTELEVVDFVKSYQEVGLDNVLCTDVAKDGMLLGPSTDLYKKLLSETSINLIASGGVNSMQDLEQLEALGCEGVVIGKAIYEGKITLEELSVLC